MKFVFHNSEVIVVCHVYIPQSGLTRPFHVTPDHDTSSERKFRCSLHDLKFTWIWLNKKGGKVETKELTMVFWWIQQSKR